MRQELLGLPLSRVQEMLAAQGVLPQITFTSAPKRANAQGGTLRVVYASDDGLQLTAARFFDPISDEKQENE